MIIIGGSVFLDAHTFKKVGRALPKVTNRRENQQRAKKTDEFREAID